MKLSNIGGFKSINEFVEWKLGGFAGDEKTFENLFKFMFSEEENVMAEASEGGRVSKTTYGECKARILKRAAALKKILCKEGNETEEIPEGSIIGLYMDNSLLWIEIFWAILICGHNPLLMNLRLHDNVHEKVIADHSVKAVISGSKEFSVKTVLAEEIIPVDETEYEAAKTPWGNKVIFMSSGTTDNIKLCAYTAENFFYQIANSAEIIKNCPEIARHYEGELKQLVLLPLYHVFGFIAVYLWFGFFSRTFVFPKDLNPRTVQSTVKKHNVTHIFAVPLVWESVYKAAIKGIKNRGDKTYKKFTKGIALANKSKLSAMLTYKSMGEVRENIFGHSIRFLISGGGHISAETLAFYNGIGYHLANGYGMTEVGITSVETSGKAKVRNSGSVGRPFGDTEYTVNESGQLLIRGKNMASTIYQGDTETETDFTKWFNSFDIAEERDGRYYLKGRCDDLIVSSTGENLNPQIIESNISLKDAEEICLIAPENKPTLIITSSVCYSEGRVRKLIEDAKAEIASLGLHGEISKIIVTPSKLLGENEFKISRKNVAKRFSDGELVVIDDRTLKEKVETLTDELLADIRRIFAETLQKDESEIGPNDHFFTDLGGTSLDYFMLADEIEDRYSAKITFADGKSLYTANEICRQIKNN